MARLADTPRVGLVDPARVVAVLLECYRGMGDGRREVDEAPAGMPPGNGLAGWHPPLACPPQLVPPETLAERCRALVRDWKIRTGRRRPAPAPETTREKVKGMSRLGHGPRREGPRARVHHFGPAGRPADPRAWR